MLQAAIAAGHARARTAAPTDWPIIVRLYEQLGALRPSPVIDLNRAVALSYAVGPAAALEVVDGLVGSGDSRTTTCCRASAATCSRGSGATTRPGPSSSGPPP